jgi:hypothetical protein
LPNSNEFGRICGTSLIKGVRWCCRFLVRQVAAFSTPMSSLHLKPPSHHLLGPTPSVSSYAGDTPSTSSSEPSTFQPTPKSNGSDQGSAASSPKRISAGLYKLQTNFDQNPEGLEPESQQRGGPSGEAEGEEGEEYDSEQEFRAARRHRSSLHTTFTADEERQVVKRFDRRLVTFLALLYMLSFLDRSSKCLVAERFQTL